MFNALRNDSLQTGRLCRHHYRRDRTVCRRHRRGHAHPGEPSSPAGATWCRGGAWTSRAGSASARAEVTAAGDGRRTVVMRSVVAALALTLWFIAPPDGLTLQAWRLFVVFAAAIVRGRAQRAAHPHGVDLRRRRLGAERAAAAVRRLCQRHDSAHCPRLPGRACRGQMRSGHPRGIHDRERVRPLHAGIVLQPLPGGRPDRAGLPATRRARRHLPAGVLARRPAPRLAGTATGVSAPS